MFQPNRTDGRSQPEVLVDLFKDALPGTIFKYQDIIQALDRGSTKAHTINEARSVVCRTRHRMLRQHARALRNVPGIGYKIAAAKENREIAIIHKHRSDRQLTKGLQTLKGVRWDELDENSRLAHEGTLMIMSALHQRQSWIERRMEKIEALLKTVGRNSDGSEGNPAPA